MDDKNESDKAPSGAEDKDEPDKAPSGMDDKDEPDKAVSSPALPMFFADRPFSGYPPLLSSQSRMTDIRVL